MGKFHSPMRLIELIKNSSSIAKELEGHNADWYLSKEGENAYNSAKTAAQKTMYFFDYLTAISKSQNSRDVLYKTAYVMANSMDGSSLEFAGYPNILDPTKNPLVSYVRRADLGSKENVAHGLMLLAALGHEEDALKYLKAEYKPYTRLTYCETDGNMTDLYKIERDIIGAFCVEFSGQYMPPYMYDIVESFDVDEENDEISDEGSVE